MPAKKKAAQNANSRITKQYDLVAPVANAETLYESIESLSGFKELSRPPIMRNQDWREGAPLIGTIEEIVESMVKDIKNPLLKMKTRSGATVLVPISAVIENALDKQPEKFIGSELAIIYLGQQPSKNDPKRRVNIFKVFVNEG